MSHLSLFRTRRGFELNQTAWQALLGAVMSKYNVLVKEGELQLST